VHHDEPAAGVWVCPDARRDEDVDWLVYYRVVEQEEELVIAEVRVVPAPSSEKEMRWLGFGFRRPAQRPRVYAEPAIPVGGLTVRRLRAALHKDEAIAMARSEGAVDKVVRDRSPSSRFPRLFTDDALKTPRRVGRRGHPDRFYAELAARYVAAMETGSKAPVAAVAKKLGHGYTPEYVRDALHRARTRGLLTRPPQGRAGGRLTDKGREALTATREGNS
jgi:hypothetical protein